MEKICESLFTFKNSFHFDEKKNSQKIHESNFGPLVAILAYTKSKVDLSLL